MPQTKLRVLFLCTEDSRHAHIAKALRHYHADKNVEAYSAETIREQVNTYTF